MVVACFMCAPESSSDSHNHKTSSSSVFPASPPSRLWTHSSLFVLTFDNLSKMDSGSVGLFKNIALHLLNVNFVCVLCCNVVATTQFCLVSCRFSPSPLWSRACKIWRKKFTFECESLSYRSEMLIWSEDFKCTLYLCYGSIRDPVSASPEQLPTQHNYNPVYTYTKILIFIIKKNLKIRKCF